MENRFKDMSDYFTGRSERLQRGRPGGGQGRATAYSVGQLGALARPMSAARRVLIILIENGGVDLQIPELVNALINAIPGSGLIPDSVKKKIRDFVASEINKPIRELSKELLEGVELLANRYAEAKPGTYGDVIVMRNSAASYEDLKKQLVAQSDAGKLIDLFILTHGSNDYIAVTGGISAARIRQIRTDYGKPLSIRSVYMMNCVGSSLNQAWRDIGAQTVSGTKRNNYIPEPTMFFFWKNWKGGMSFADSVTLAYQQTITLINDALRSLLGSLSLPGIDVRNLQVIKDSEPVVSGQGSLTVGSDDLDFSKSLAASATLRAVGTGLLRSLSDGGTASNSLKVSDRGIDFIKQFEGFEPKPKPDPVGHCSVGYGTLLHKGACDGRASEVPYAGGISKEDATTLLAQEVAGAEPVINQTASKQLNQDQFDALVSFVYNVGTANFQQSMLAKLLVKGDYAAVPDELKKWTKARIGSQLVDLPGLVRRRVAEAALFQTNAAESQMPWSRPAQSSRQMSVSRALVVGLEDRQKARKYGPDFRKLFQWSVPTSVVRAVEARGFKVQTIDAAVGDLNLDRYPVAITRFPNSWDAPRLLQHFIRNINQFVDTRLTEFIPYDESDAQRLVSSNPVGTVIKLDLLGPDNAAVVISAVEPQFYIVTTINTPWSGDHPVSGHRQFGYTNEEGGKTTFYTRGADRATLGFPGTEHLIFLGGEKVWESFQRKLAAFINDNGGVAEIISPFSERFDATAMREEFGRFDVAQSLSPALAMSTVAFNFNWDEVELIPQPTDVSCWAAAAAMVVGWKELLSLSPEAVAKIAGRTTATGLDPAQVKQFAREIGLAFEYPQSYTVDGFRRLLDANGPLWIGAAVPGLHAIVVTGMYEDGTNAFVRISDPWDRQVGRPGAAGAYLNAHLTGSRYIMGWEDFMREYETAATNFSTVNLQILHSGGPGGHQASRGSPSPPPGYAQSIAARGRYGGGALSRASKEV